jgi:predicted metal-binding membrane protein
MSTRTDGTRVSSTFFHPGVASTWVVLAGVGAAGWAVTVIRAVSMGSGPGTMGMALPFFAVMWLAMMAAMMLPALGPQAAGEVVSARAAGVSRFAGTLAFGGGFLLPWVAYGLLAYLALLGTGRLAADSPGPAKSLGVAIFAIAGIYQFTPAKRWALGHCRKAMAAYGGGPVSGGFVSGARDGVICVGCCWALMTVLFATGVMNIWVMAGLASVIFGEKVLPRPRVVAGLAGVVLLGLALAAVIHPSLLAGLRVAETGMRSMTGM